MLVIGLVGKKFAGKSTAALRLLERHGFNRGKFAAALKEMLRVLLRYRGVDAETVERMIEGDMKERPSVYLNGKTPRHAMQTLGAEWGRDLIDQNLWVDTEADALDLRLRYLNSDRIVFDDVRYQNEVDTIRKFGGQIWEIRRPALPPSGDEHSSEKLEVVPDQIIYNPGCPGLGLADCDLGGFYRAVDFALDFARAGA